jgi:hypothetical protein
VTFTAGLYLGKYYAAADLEYQEPGRPDTAVGLTDPDTIEITNHPGTVLTTTTPRWPDGRDPSLHYQADVPQDSHYDFNLVVGDASQLATVPAPDAFTGLRFNGNTADPSAQLVIPAHWNGPTVTVSWDILDGSQVDISGPPGGWNVNCPIFTLPPASGADPGKLDLSPPNPSNSSGTCNYEILVNRTQTTPLTGTLKVKSGTLVQENTLNILYQVGP